MVDQLESAQVEGYTPKALEKRPFLTEYEDRVLAQYLRLAEQRPIGMSGICRLSLREIDLYLQYYPVADVHYFIDLMQEIDRLYCNGINAKEFGCV